MSRRTKTRSLAHASRHSILVVEGLDGYSKDVHTDECRRRWIRSSFALTNQSAALTDHPDLNSQIVDFLLGLDVGEEECRLFRAGGGLRASFMLREPHQRLVTTPSVSCHERWLPSARTKARSCTSTQAQSSRVSGD